MRGAFACVLLVLAGCELNPAFDPLGGAGEGDGSGADTLGPTAQPGEPLGDVCPALPAAEGEVVTVTPEQAGELQSIVAGVNEGTTIVFEPGVYALPDGLYISTPGVTLRGATGNPDDVVLDGQRTAGSLLFVVAGGVTMAEMTLQRSQQHLVHMSGNDTTPAPGILGYRLNLYDPGSSAFKANPNYEGAPADDGTLACSHIALRDGARTEEGFPCTGAAGLAMFGISGWHVRDNLFEGFWCDTGYSGAAIHFSETSGNVLVERNVIRDCVIGIHLGLYEDGEGRRSYPDYTGCTEGYFDHYGGVVRNNMILATGTGIAASDIGLDTGIALWQACDTTVVHNTVVSAIGALSSIEYRFGRTKARVLNNLVTNEIVDRDDAGVPVAGNLQEVDVNNFVDPFGGDAHLVPGSEARDAGVQLGADAVTHDIDGEPRSGTPDIGADELP